MRRPRRDVTARRGSGALVSLPYRGSSDEIDLDRTIEVLAEHPVPEDEDIFVRERMRTQRSVVLLVDVSGSMKGERIRTAAAVVGALSAELEHDALGGPSLKDILQDGSGPIGQTDVVESIVLDIPTSREPLLKVA